MALVSCSEEESVGDAEGAKMGVGVIGALFCTAFETGFTSGRLGNGGLPVVFVEACPARLSIHKQFS